MLFARAFVGQQKERSDSIMGAFAATDNRDTHSLLIAGIAVAALILLFIIANRYANQKPGRK
jgi:uncharacterized integral membrane protein